MPALITGDIISGLAVAIVALPLCLGIALASGAPLFSGLLSGAIGGLIIGILSGSQTSVSGPAAGLAAIVATQISALGSFQGFLTAVVLAGALQVALGLFRAGFIASFFPSSVIKGLLAAIGTILVLKQVPHVLGHDPDPVGDMSFTQSDGENTFSELLASMFDIQPGAALIGLGSLLLIFVWSRIKVLQASRFPVPVVVVLGGVIANELWIHLKSGWAISVSHRVQVPITNNLNDAMGLVTFPDWSTLQSPAIIGMAITLALVATLETLVNLEAIDRLDPRQRVSPPNRELLAQGVGNMTAGLLGGLPVTSVIVRSSVNIHSGNHTRLSAIFHGVLLLGSILLIPHVLNMIPLASLAAILIATGFKLASPQLFKQMWAEGKRQFLPFAITIASIVLLDLLKGILIGLGVSLSFVLYSNFKRPLNRTVEQHASGDVWRIELANQVGFFSRGALERALNDAPWGGHVLIDARNCDYIDPDILDLIFDFRTKAALARDIKLSVLGFKDHYPELPDEVHYVEHATPEVQSALSGGQVLALLQEGNQRFLKGRQLNRDYRRQVSATAPGQAPLAVVLSCMDSRAPVELIFDLGIGDAFSVRVAGNVAAPKVLGSLEYGCSVAGAKLLLVLGHTACGAVSAAVKFRAESQSALEATGCDNIGHVVRELDKSIDQHLAQNSSAKELTLTASDVDAVVRTNVLRTMAVVVTESSALELLIHEGKLLLVGGIYDVSTGNVEFFDEHGKPLAIPHAA